MINILIVEDDLLIAEMLKEMLTDLGYEIKAISKNYKEAEQSLLIYPETNLVFLDINLGEGKSGVDVATHIKENYKIPFIYLTSYSDPKTVMEATKTIPDAYLLKPFTKNDLFSTLEMVKVRNSDLVSHSIVVKAGNTNVKLSSNEILYVQSEKNYIEIITDPKRYVVRTSLDAFISELNDPFFIRVHRSFAVNMKKVNSIKNQQLYGDTFSAPLSRNYKEEVMSFYNS